MKNILKILEDGKLLLSPTDTIWGILCDATNAYAVDKVYKCSVSLVNFVAILFF